MYIKMCHVLAGSWVLMTPVTNYMSTQNLLRGHRGLISAAILGVTSTLNL